MRHPFPIFLLILALVHASAGLAAAQADSHALDGTAHATDQSPTQAPTQAHAQEQRPGARKAGVALGFTAGPIFSTLVGEDATSAFNEYEHKSGMAWGIFADLPLHIVDGGRLHFFLRPELLLSSKGRETTNDGNQIALLDLSYASISLMGRVAYSLGSQWTIHALGGLEGSYLYDAILLNYQNGGFTEQNELLNRYDVGWNIGVGIQASTWERQSVVLEGFFRRSLLDIDEDVDLQNRALAVMVSYRIPLWNPSAP